MSNHHYVYCSCCCAWLRLCRWAHLGSLNTWDAFLFFCGKSRLNSICHQCVGGLKQAANNRFVFAVLCFPASMKQQLHTTWVCIHERDGFSIVEFSPQSSKYHLILFLHLTWIVCLAPLPFTFIAHVTSVFEIAFLFFFKIRQKKFKYVNAIASHSATTLFKLILLWTDLIGFYFITASTFTGRTFNAIGLVIPILLQ